MPNGTDVDKEQSEFIAFLFMDGADKKQHGYLLKNLEEPQLMLPKVESAISLQRMM